MLPRSRSPSLTPSAQPSEENPHSSFASGSWDAAPWETIALGLLPSPAPPQRCWPPSPRLAPHASPSSSSKPHKLSSWFRAVLLLGLPAVPPSHGGWGTSVSPCWARRGQPAGQRPACPPAVPLPAPQLRAVPTRSSAELALVCPFAFTCCCSAAITSKLNSRIVERKTLFCFSY